MTTSTTPPPEAARAFAPADYVPHRRWTGGHWMTIYTWARRRRFARLPEPEVRFFDVAPEARVLAHVHWQAARREAPTLIALHGLEGSSSDHYMVGLEARRSPAASTSCGSTSATAAAPSPVIGL